MALASDPLPEAAMKKNPILGKRIEWTFDDGPMAHQTFEHTFDAEGGVSYRMPGADGAGQPTRVENAKVEPVGENVYVVSYLGAQGYTLTTILDIKTHRMVAIASNERELSVQKGKFKLPDEASARRKTSRERSHAPAHRS
jgi:hypothetical protein